MFIREDIEKMQDQAMSSIATRSDQSRGRKCYEEEDDFRTAFQRDRDRILHSKAFRRLKHKTQVFISPEGDHYRTRLTHTLEVSQIGRTMARALGLNEDLVEAIALGHDVGHTPFGHAGEYVLQKIIPDFSHAAQSVRVLSFLETRKKARVQIGLNLTWEVLDGIANHSGKNEAKTAEGKLIKFADRIAYVNHDIDDAIRAGVLSENDLPEECIEKLGNSPSKRIDSMVRAVISETDRSGKVGMEHETLLASRKLRQYMFKEVYTNALVKSENEKLLKIIEDVFTYYVDHPEALPHSHLLLYVGEFQEETTERKVADYIAGMTDDFLIRTYNDIFIPKAWNKI